jgi:hypothetical protein
MIVLAESMGSPTRPRTLRSITRRRAALRHDIEVVGTSRAKPPRDYSWRSALILLLLNIILITLAMRWDGFFDWW